MKLEEKISLARALREEGKSVRYISKEIGLTKHTVGKYTDDIYAKKMKGKKYLSLAVKSRRLLKEFLREVQKDKRVKEGSPNGILTIIAKQLKVSPEFVLRHTEGLVDESVFVDNDIGMWTDEVTREVYINSRYLMWRLGLSDSYSSQMLRKANLPSILLWTNVKTRRPQPFYRLSDVRRYIPAIREKLDDVEMLESLPDDEIPKLRPEKLKKSHYQIFCCLLRWRNRLGYWPTNRQLSELSQGKYTCAYTKRTMRALKDKGYIAVDYPDGNVKGRKDITVHWGPYPLVTEGGMKEDKLAREDRAYVERRCALQEAEPR